MKQSERDRLAQLAEIPVIGFAYPCQEPPPGTQFYSPVGENWGIRWGTDDKWLCSPVLTKAKAELFSASLNNFLLR